ncbi:MAG: L,D-transpeptidase family protein [Clostridiaceae bacterium]
MFKRFLASFLIISSLFFTAPSIVEASNSKYVIVVDITLDKLTVFKNGEVHKEYLCSGGKPSTPSPIGSWRIINKHTWGEGFGGRWLGFNVPWGKYGIHGNKEPGSVGWNSSHGCIRMHNNEVKELYSYIPVGTPVIIYGGPFGNFGEGYRIIRPGMIGSDIYEVQKILKAKGYFKGYVSGAYNSEDFKLSIHKFQKDNKLPVNDYITMDFYKKLGDILID